MSGVGSSAGSDAGRAEQLIGALVPPAARRSAPVVPLVAPMVPLLGLPAGAGSSSLLLDMARLDASGRFCSRGLYERWAGDRVIASTRR
jgi:hypothetical protein